MVMIEREKIFIHLTSHVHEQSWKTQILGESKDWICLNKHTHLGTEHDHHHQDRPTMASIIEHDLERRAGWIREREIQWLKPVNIIDFETTGVSLWAKNEAAETVLKDAMHSELPNRTYHALVHGTPEEEQFEIDLKLTPHSLQPWVMKASKDGKKSVSLFETLTLFRGYTLLKCLPITERYHQVRAHLACKQHAVVADATYGGEMLMLSQLKSHYRFKKDRPERPLMDRATIHLAELEFEDPDSGELLKIQAPVHHDWEVALRYLEKFADALE